MSSPATMFSATVLLVVAEANSGVMGNVWSWPTVGGPHDLRRFVPQSVTTVMVTSMESLRPLGSVAVTVTIVGVLVLRLAGPALGLGLGPSISGRTFGRWSRRSR